MSVDAVSAVAATAGGLAAAEPAAQVAGRVVSTEEVDREWRRRGDAKEEQSNGAGRRTITRVRIAVYGRCPGAQQPAQ